MGLRGIGAKPRKGRYRTGPRRREVLPWDKPSLSRAERVIAFLEDLTVTSGPLSGKKFKVRPWQREFIEAVYREEEGNRPVRTAVLSMGRKNGKTQLAAGLALCHLSGPETESRGEVYSCANDRFQAGKIFNEMVALVNAHTELGDRINIIRFRKELEDLNNGSIYAALSAEVATKMGLSPSFVVYDELGQAPKRDLYDAMDTAMGGRAQPLMLVISTQAADNIAPLSQIIDDALNFNDPSIHLSLYAAPEDADPWAEKTWTLANPALGDFRSLEDVRRMAEQAKRMPAKEMSFRNLILNQRVAAEARFINRAEWDLCGGPAVIPDGAQVFAALDLGATRDMSALVLVHRDINGIFHVQPHFWLPGDVHERASGDGVPYDVWMKEGYLRPAGTCTDPAMIARAIAELSKRYRIQTLAYDRWHMDEIRRELHAIGCYIPMVEHGQGYKDMSPAVNALERLIVEQRMRHGKHPVMDMCAVNAIVTRDHTGARKLDKVKSTGRIDGLVALAMAFSLAVVKVEAPADVGAMIA